VVLVACVVFEKCAYRMHKKCILILYLSPTLSSLLCDETDAKLKMRKYCEELPRPFFALYNTQTETVHIDGPVRRAVGVPTPSTKL